MPRSTLKKPRGRRPKKSTNSFESWTRIHRKVISQTENKCVVNPDSDVDVLKALSVKAIGLPLLQNTNYYNKEEDFLNQEKINVVINDDNNDLRLLLQNFESGHLSFIGPIGSGKTTLMKIIVQGTLDEKSYFSEVQVIFFLDSQDFSSDQKLTPGDLLLKRLDNVDRRSKQGYMRMIRRKPKKFLFVIDSLDTLPFSLQERRPKMAIDGEELPATILSNMLSDSLFPGVRIITTSREFAIRHLPEEVRPKKVVALAGFSEKSIASVVNVYFEEDKKAESIRKEIENEPSLQSICSRPLFLSYVLYCYKSEGMFRSHTMTRILDKVFQKLFGLLRLNGNSSEVMRSLASLGFQCGKNISPVFDINLPKSQGLTKEDVLNFISCGILRNGFQNEDLLSFCHSAIQEYLAAKHISQLQKKEFRSFSSTEIGEQKFSSTACIICGLLFDKEISGAKVATIKDIGEKRIILKDWIRRKLEDESSNGKDMLQIIIAIFEAGDGLDDLIDSKLHSIVVKGETCLHSLSSSDIYAIATVAGKARKMRKLQLPHNNLTVQNFHVLTKVLLSVDSIAISEIDFSDNFLIGSRGLACAGKIANHCRAEVLDLHGCDLDANDVHSLRNGMNGLTVKRLDLSYSHAVDTKEKMKNENRRLDFEFKQRESGVQFSVRQDGIKIMPIYRELRIRQWQPGEWEEVDDDVIEQLTKLVPKVSEEIKLFGWKLSDSQRDKLQLSLDRQGITNLKIALTRNDSIVSSTSRKLLTFRKDTEKSELEQTSEDDSAVRDLLEVQIAHFPLTEERIDFLASKLEGCQKLEEMQLRDCELDEARLKIFDAVVEKTDCKRIRRFAVSLSNRLSDLLPEISKIVKTHNTTILSIAENDVTGEDLSKLEELLTNDEVTELYGLDISNNENIVDLKPLGLLVQSRKLTDLTLINCELTDEKLESLPSVKCSTVKSLNISYNSEITQSGFRKLSTLLHPEKLDLLDISGCEITYDKLIGLKDLLDKREVESIVFNYNELGCSEMMAIGGIAVKSKIRKIGVTGCDLNRRPMVSLNRSLGEHKLYSIDAADNKGISECMQDVAELAKKCSALNISECGTEAEELDEFIFDMKEYTLECLNVSDSNRGVVEGGRLLQSLQRLVRVMTKRLILCFKEVDTSSRAILQSELDKSEKKDLTIIFDQSVHCETQNGFHFVMTADEDTLKRQQH